MAERMGLSMSYVHQLEVSKRTPSDAIETLVRMMEDQVASGMIESDDSEKRRETSGEPAMGRVTTFVPVIGWAHAGAAENYEEIPRDWQDSVAADPRDKKAFAVRLEGNSMEPKYSAGDILILQPSQEIYSGCLAVVKLRDNGFIFRQVEKRPGLLRLIPLNTQWSEEDIPLELITWAIPVWRMIREVSKQ